MTTTQQAQATPKTGARHLALAIVALAMGGFGIGTTEFTMMGLLKEVEQGLNISTP
jgi:DHA1 family inner membrane transport protein